MLDPGGKGHEGDRHDVEYGGYRPTDEAEHGTLLPGRSCRTASASLARQISGNGANDSDCYLSFIGASGERATFRVGPVRRVSAAGRRGPGARSRPRWVAGWWW